MSVTVHHGDSRNVLKGMADASIDSVVCDPPYALVSIGKRFGKDGAAPARAGKTGAYARASSGFMGQKWDTGETAFDPAFWVEVLRVLKPGGTVLDPFAGSGTTGLAAMREGFSAVLIEREEQYVADIHRRLKWARGEGRLTAQEKSRHQDEAPMGGLFASIEPDLAQGGAGPDAPRLRRLRAGRQIGPTGLKR